MSGYGKRTFATLQFTLLTTLKKGPMSVHDIAKKSGINWNTTKRQLIHLKGQDLVREVFSHPRLRIYEITEKGKQVADIS
jgi:predicted transcriptional regulator